MHNDVTRSPWRFSLRDLSVVVICVCVLLALVVPLIQVGHESSRKTTCANNLKLLGVTILNFHDTRRGLPPLSIGEGRASMFVVLLPYLETGPNPFLNAVDATIAVERIDGQNGFWSRLSSQERELTELYFTRCPGRGRRSPSFVNEPDDDYFGPTGDYAIVFFNGRVESDTNTFRAVKEWDRHFDPCDEAQVERQFGAIRLAKVDCDARGGPDYRRWQPRDTFARITDGTSNTLILGEKYVRRGEVNRYADAPEQQDGTFLFEARGRRSASVARNLWFPLALKNDPRFRLGMKANPQRDFGFGGPHSDGVLFGVADGSVRTVAHQTDRTLLYRLGHCQDAVGLAGIGPLVTPADAFDFDDPAVPGQR